MRPEDVWEINQWCAGTDTRPPEVVAEIERERALKRDQYRALRRGRFRSLSGKRRRPILGQRMMR